MCKLREHACWNEPLHCKSPLHQHYGYKEAINDFWRNAKDKMRPNTLGKINLGIVLDHEVGPSRTGPN